MSRLSSALIVASAAAAVAAIAVSVRPRQSAFRGRPMLRIVSPYLSVPFAESVIASFDSIGRGSFYVLIDTYGGQVTAVAMMLKAMSERQADITAIVPRLAFSGGTLLALCSSRIVAGRRAYFSPVDPQFNNCAASELNASPVAVQYSNLVTGWVDTLIKSTVEEDRRPGLRSLLLGEKVPHGWPLAPGDLSAAGLPVEIDRSIT